MRNSRATESTHRAQVSHHPAKPSRRNSLATESSHRAQVSHNPAQNRSGETYMLPNQAVGLRSVTVQRRIVAERLTACRIKPSSSSQSPSSEESLMRNSPTAESSHWAQVSHRELYDSCRLTHCSMQRTVQIRTCSGQGKLLVCNLLVTELSS